MKKVTVEKDLCIKCGACMQIAENTFGYAPSGHSEVKNEVADADDKNVIAAMEACPTGAIRIEDVPGTETSGCACEHCNCDPCECGDECDCEDCAGCEHEE